jgi:glutaminyl-tRNA synthetase
MKAGEIDEGEKVLRAKIDMSSPNLNMRDPVLYRIVKAPHHRTDDQWVYTLCMIFAHPLEDVGRHNPLPVHYEFEDHRPLYDWVIANTDNDCARTSMSLQG